MLPRHAPDRSRAQVLADQVFQGFDPGSDWSLFDRGQIEPGALALRIARRTGLTAGDVRAVIDAIPSHLATQDDTVCVLQDLRAAGHRLCYLSNMPAPYADSLLRDKPFFALFEAGLFSAHVQQIKPEAVIYAQAVQRWGLQGRAVWFIDDVQRNLDAAVAHGWQGVQHTSAAGTRAALVAGGLLSR